MMPMMIIPSAALPAEGFDEGFREGNGEGGCPVLAMFRMLRGLQMADDGGLEFGLLRMNAADGGGFDVFPFSLVPGVGMDAAGGMGAALQGWLEPLGIATVICGRAPKDFVGVFLCPHRELDDFRQRIPVLESEGWSFEFPDDEVAGHGMREMAMAGILGLGLLGPMLDASASPTPTPTHQVAPDAAMFRVNEALLAEAREPGAEIAFVVDLTAQRGYLMVNGKVAVETRVCTGRPGKGTPTGTFTIGEKVRTGKISTIYRVALPYWMRLTNDGIGLHVGEIHDTPSSAGCVRLPAGIAATLFDHLPKGTEVRIEKSLEAGMEVAVNEGGD